MSRTSRTRSVSGGRRKGTIRETLVVTKKTRLVWAMRRRRDIIHVVYTHRVYKDGWLFELVAGVRQTLTLKGVIYIFGPISVLAGVVLPDRFALLEE